MGKMGGAFKSWVWNFTIGEEFFDRGLRGFTRMGERQILRFWNSESVLIRAIRG